MNKLEALIRKLCPNGVEYVKLKDCVDMERGKPLIKKNATCGVYPVVSSGKEPAFYCNQYNREGETITVASSGANAGFVQYWCQPICVCDAFSIKTKTKALTKYLYYCLNSMQDKIFLTQTKGAIPHVYRASIENFEIPIPPFEVQKEIVHILDKFSRYITTLIDLLTKEITLRKKQYAYYRNKLFTFNDTVLKVTLKEIAENYDYQRKPITARNRVKGEYPYYGASGKIDSIKDYLFDGDYLLISEDGANLLARTTPIAFSILGKTWVNNHAHILKFETYETRRFIEFYFNAINLTPWLTGTTQPKLTQQNLNKIEIPLPSLEEQSHIVCKLDCLEKFYNNLIENLLTEITIRKKQYIHYRNKVLRFNRIEA